LITTFHPNTVVREESPPVILARDQLGASRKREISYVSTTVEE
jgi:hypothetical protein